MSLNPRSQYLNTFKFSLSTLLAFFFNIRLQRPFPAPCPQAIPVFILLPALPLAAQNKATYFSKQLHLSSVQFRHSLVTKGLQKKNLSSLCPGNKGQTSALVSCTWRSPIPTQDCKSEPTPKEIPSANPFPLFCQAL